MNLYLLIIFSSLRLWADITLENYVINGQYRSGNNLIYNCNQKIFVCVTSAGKIQCDTDRQNARENNLLHYPCAVLKSFATKEECFNKNYEVANVNAFKRYCVLDRLKH